MTPRFPGHANMNPQGALPNKDPPLSSIYRNFNLNLRRCFYAGQRHT